MLISYPRLLVIVNIAGVQHRCSMYAVLSSSAGNHRLYRTIWNGGIMFGSSTSRSTGASAANA